MNTPSLPDTQRILSALKAAREQLAAVEQSRQERVAIIGMAGRFPGAETLSDFWHLLSEGKVGIQVLSDAELAASGIEPEEWQQPNYVKAFASFASFDQFAASFFDYSPREAELIDPQHRVFLEVAWEALEHAGYDPDRAPRIGVFAGASLNSYIINLHTQPHLRDSTDPVQAVVSNVMGLMPTRVSYKLNLTGPSCGVQTGCSTSLVAVHLACQSLLSGECDLALAGGISIAASGRSGYRYQPDGVLSPDGICRAFDAQAQGTVFGNGVGIVVLKRLSAALGDRDTIYAVIKGSAINNDGAEKVGLTAPSVRGQAEVITAALAKAGVAPATLQYLEAHGTGTALGDPIEIAALTKAFRQQTQATQFCAIGSVKTNIGHLDAAAGISGLIKTTLALHHRQIPPSLNFTSPNPQIDFANSPFSVNTHLRDWPTADTPARAGVSSFGMGGTNAHVVLEAAPPVPVTSPSRPWQLLLVSAKTETALATACTQLATHLQQQSPPLADVAYTLQVGRRSHPHRVSVVCQSVEQASQALHHPSPTLVQQTQRPLVWLFPGQGSQYLQMGRGLYDQEPLVRTWVDRGCELLKPILDCDLRDLLYPASDASSDRDLMQTCYAQPALFVLEYAIAQQWLAWGVQPEALLGHSLGEYVAATIAGVFTYEEALTTIARRAAWMQSCPAGAMLAVFLPEPETRSHLSPGLTIAALNAPNLCVVSGEIAAISQLEAALGETRCRRLHTSHAFHSPLIEPAIAPLRQHLQQLRLQPPQIPILSNLTGTWLTPEQATDPEYWCAHLRQPVQFSPSLRELAADAIFLEVGPGTTLSQLVARSTGAPDRLILSSLRHPQDPQPDLAGFLQTLGKLWQAGVAIDWQAFTANEQRQRVPLPTYPFERQRYWVDVASAAPALTPEPSPAKLPVEDWFTVPTWQRSAPLPVASPTHQRWLVFVNADDRGLTERLREMAPGVVTVQLSDQFQALAPDRYGLNPERSEDYRQLIAALEAQNALPQQILHLWQWENSPEPDFETQQTRGFLSLLWLTQALLPDRLPERLIVITDQTQTVSDTEPLHPAKATITGYCQVLAQEYPQIACQLIDVAASALSAKWLDRTLTQLLSEFAQPDCPDRIIAYRDRHRWVKSFTPATLPATVPHLLKPGGTYFIVGDLIEGLGLVYARYLVETLQSNLVLIGRAPARSDWETWLATHAPQDPTSRAIRALQSIESLGRMTYHHADLSDEPSLRLIVETALPKTAPIHGVIHAGTMGDRSSCPIAALDRTTVQQQFQTKVQGLMTLERVLHDRAIGFYLLQSSLSTVVGGVGFAAYAAANHFMDAFAQQQSQLSDTPWLSVNWDACRDKEGDENPTPPTGSTLLDLALTPSEVWQASDRILAQPHLTQVAVSPRPLSQRLQAAAQPIPTTGHDRPSLTTPYVAPRNPTEQTIASLMQELLGIDRIGIDDNFFELGGHSLLAIQAVSRLREIFQVELPMREFLFESPTVAGIAKIIQTNQAAPDPDLDTLLSQIEQMTPEQIQSQLTSDT
jgi:acyl transferase domain-containing protein